MNLLSGLAQSGGDSTQVSAVMVLTVILALLVFILFLVSLYLAKLWIRALMSGVRITLATIIGMKLRRVPALLIIDTVITAKKAGIDVGVNDLEVHHLAGGDVRKVVQAIIIAETADIDLSWREAASVDLAGRDVVEEVQAVAEKRSPAVARSNEARDPAARC